MTIRSKLVTDPPGRALFFFALPMILGNLFQQFYNMADSVIVGQLVGENALAAVGASYSFTTVFIMFAIGGGIGASVLTSRYAGAEKYEDMKSSVYTFLIAFAILSTALAVFGLLINPTVLYLLKTPDNIIDDAILYLQIYFCGLPFTFMYNILSSNFNALGRSKIPLIFLICSSLLNIGLDIWMVGPLEMGVAGAALATVIAQGISMIISLFCLLWLLKKYQTDGPVPLFRHDLLRIGTKLAIPSIIQQSIVSIGMLLTQSAVNFFGSSALAGFSAGARLESLFIVPMISTGNAVSTLTAQNLGAGRPERVRLGLQKAHLQIVTYGIILAVICLLFRGTIVSAFLDADDSPVAFQVASSYFLTVGLTCSLLGFKAITDSVLRGAGDVQVYMIASLINLSIRVSVAHLCAPIWGIHLVWFAVPVGWAINWLIALWRYRSGKWKQVIL